MVVVGHTGEHSWDDGYVFTRTSAVDDEIEEPPSPQDSSPSPAGVVIRASKKDDENLRDPGDPYALPICTSLNLRLLFSARRHWLADLREKARATYFEVSEFVGVFEDFQLEMEPVLQSVPEMASELTTRCCVVQCIRQLRASFGLTPAEETSW